MELLYLIPAATSLMIFGVVSRTWATIGFSSLLVHHQNIRSSMLQQFYFDKVIFRIFCLGFLVRFIKFYFLFLVIIILEENCLIRSPDHKCHCLMSRRTFIFVIITSHERLFVPSETMFELSAIFLPQPLFPNRRYYFITVDNTF